MVVEITASSYTGSRASSNNWYVMEEKSEEHRTWSNSNAESVSHGRWGGTQLALITISRSLIRPQ
jgi:hypothetical protein